jgi:hypothetical protein
MFYRFLGYVDLKGTTYQNSTIATGFGGHLAQPILRKAVEGREDTLTEEEAIKIIDDCMRVLFYRDARSINKVCFMSRIIGYSPCLTERSLIYLVHTASKSENHSRRYRNHRAIQCSNGMVICRIDQGLWCVGLLSK